MTQYFIKEKTWGRGFSQSCHTSTHNVSIKVLQTISRALQHPKYRKISIPTAVGCGIHIRKIYGVKLFFNWKGDPESFNAIGGQDFKVSVFQVSLIITTFQSKMIFLGQVSD